MRGKAVQKMWATDHQRITPAYAGKSTKNTCCCVSEDHPRLCGEKLSRFPAKVSEMGSPPPMRGKAGRCAASVPNWRITPAYAGKSLMRSLCLYPPWDHPRLCGEKQFPDSHRRRGTGSPPPMRGKARLRAVLLTLTGITPAYAGKSRLGNFSAAKKRDHPRLCGEKVRV